ncbi:MAG: hypothetical protein ACUVXJ_05670 [Phycisphaerae bacterium]
MIEILPCVALLLVVGVPTVLLVILIMRRRGRHVGEPACGKCGYAVRGLPTFTCPECGSDLREVGIVTEGQSSMSPAMRGWLLVLVWTLILPIPACLVTALIGQAAPQVNSTTARKTLDDPRSNAYRRIELVQNRVKRDSTVLSNDLTVMLLPSQGEFLELEYYAKARRYAYRRKSGEKVQADGGLDMKVILDWMAQAGIDIEDQQVKSEAAELTSMIQAASGGLVSDLRHRQFSSSGASASSHVGPPSWLLIVAAVFWLAVWLLGCWRFWKISTRKQG